jgi:hypothetical protein
LREQYAAEIAEIMNRPEAKELFTMFEQDHINRWATYLLNVEEPHKEQTMGHGTEQYNDQNKEFDVLALQQDFKRFFSQYDTRRGKDFVTTFPRLKEWYNDIQI